MDHEDDPILSFATRAATNVQVGRKVTYKADQTPRFEMHVVRVPSRAVTTASGLEEKIAPLYSSGWSLAGATPEFLIFERPLVRVEN